jgi:hypothetical protein
MPNGTRRARLLLLLTVLLTVILGTSGRAQNQNSGFPHAAGGGWATDGLGFVHFAFAAMNGPSGPPSAKGHGRFSYPNGSSDQGDVICFSVQSPTVAQFTIDVSKGAHNYLLVRVEDTEVMDTVTYQVNQPDCTLPQLPANAPGLVTHGNVVVSDGN